MKLKVKIKVKLKVRRQDLVLLRLLIHHRLSVKNMKVVIFFSMCHIFLNLTRCSGTFSLDT